VNGASSWPPEHEEFAATAREVVEHIERAGWEMRRKPMAPLPPAA
jgi:hypothetical protein